MTLKKVLTSIRHAIVGKPVSHEEQQAARHRPTRDPMVDAQYETRSTRFTGMHF